MQVAFSLKPQVPHRGAFPAADPVACLPSPRHLLLTAGRRFIAPARVARVALEEGNT